MQSDTDSLKLSREDHLLKTGSTSFTCDECGKRYRGPILATISISGQIDRYYACPRCMTRVNNVKIPESSLWKESSTPNRKPKKPATEPENTVKCEHFFGYLRKRGKETPIPEECLTCSKMFECMFHEAKSQNP